MTEVTDIYKPIPGEYNNTNEDFELDVSDEEMRVGNENEWEPSPNEIIDLFEKINTDTVLQLEWTTPGRRPPTPPEKQDFNNTAGNEVEICREVEQTDFDFKDEMSNLRLLTKSMRPGGPDAILRGSAKKKTTSLDAILSNMARHRKLDMMEDDDDLLP